MQYVRCIHNETYIEGDLAETFEPDLIIGKVYKRLPDAKAESHGMIRVIDGSYGQPGSEEGYMYPAGYFEAVDLHKPNGHTDESITIRVPKLFKDILHAEAVASDKSISSLVRDWIDERLDLPERVPKT